MSGYIIFAFSSFYEVLNNRIRSELKSERQGIWQYITIVAGCGIEPTNIWNIIRLMTMIISSTETWA